MKNYLQKNNKIYRNKLFISLGMLFIFGNKLHVYIDQYDDHRDFFMQNSFGCNRDIETNDLEFDSNLHDVYLCALLAYLMEYGEGQLCFTTHNVGPMDVLKQHKKSIDFLSVDHKIYPWTKNGNYSPSKLYRNGMIEGSPFNVDTYLSRHIND